MLNLSQVQLPDQLESADDVYYLEESSAPTWSSRGLSVLGAALH